VAWWALSGKPTHRRPLNSSSSCRHEKKKKKKSTLNSKINVLYGAEDSGAVGEVEKLWSTLTFQNCFLPMQESSFCPRGLCTVTSRFVFKISKEDALTFAREVLASWKKRGKPLPYIQASSQHGVDEKGGDAKMK
jgi:hypothetical protein